MPEEKLNIITKTTARERKNIFNWMGSLTESERIKIIQKAVKIGYKLKEQQTGLESCEQKYAALILAACKLGWDTKHSKGFRVADEKQFTDFNNMREAVVADFLKKGRKPLIRKKTLAYWGEIVELQKSGLGFCRISKYLKEKRKLNVSASYLAQIWKKLGQKI